MKARPLIITGAIAALIVLIFVEWHRRTPISASPSGESAGATLIDFPFLDRAGVTNADHGGYLVTYPPDLAQLDNQRVSLVGFMAPYEQIDDMRHFLLLPSYVGCFFCAPPSFTQVLLVEQRAATGGKLPFINDPVLVTGTLRLYSKGSQHPAHRAEFVYALDDAAVSVYQGDHIPVRAVAVHATNRGQGTRDGKPAYGNALAHSAPADAGQPKEPFRPQSLLTVVTDLRKLPMLEPIQFQPATGEEIVARLTDTIVPLRSRSQWRSYAKACMALGLADQPFEMPRVLSSIALHHKAGFYNPSSHTIYYLKNLASAASGKPEMVRLITEALIMQNEPWTAASDDEVLAGLSLRTGDCEATVRRYEEGSGTAPAGQEPPPIFVSIKEMEPPEPLQRLGDLLREEGAAFVTKLCPGGEPGSLKQLYEHPPRTTSEVAHPERYQNRAPLGPQSTPAADPGSASDSPLMEDVLGEAVIAVWLGGKNNPATVNGWRSDRFQLWDNGAEGYSWVLNTEWTNGAAAGAIFSAIVASRDHGTAKIETPDPNSQSATIHAGGHIWRVILRKDHARVFAAQADSDARLDALVTKFSGS